MLLCPHFLHPSEIGAGPGLLQAARNTLDQIIDGLQGCDWNLQINGDAKSSFWRPEWMQLSRRAACGIHVGEFGKMCAEKRQKRQKITKKIFIYSSPRAVSICDGIAYFFENGKLNNNNEIEGKRLHQGVANRKQLEFNLTYIENVVQQVGPATAPALFLHRLLGRPMTGKPDYFSASLAFGLGKRKGN
jgi:hypothetical protein